MGLNAAKEIALDKFIAGEIKFLEITSLVQQVLASSELLELENKNAQNFEDILYADTMTRSVAGAIKIIR